MNERSEVVTGKRHASKRDEHAADRRNQLIDTALVIFSKKGFDKTSVRELSQAAGVAQGLLYHYFPSKDKLLEAVVERHSFMPQLRELILAAAERPANEVLTEVAVAFYDLLGQKESLINIFFHESQINPRVPLIWHKLLNQGLTLFQGYLDSRIAAGELKPHQSEVTARTMTYTVVMLRATERAFAHKTRPDGFIREMVDNLLGGIQA